MPHERLPVDFARVTDIDVLAAADSLDDALLDAATLGLSPAETARRLDGAITPARVIVRTRELLAEGDWLTELERERALLRTLEARIVELQRAHDLDSIKVQGTLVSRVLDQLNRRNTTIEDQLGRFNAEVGRFMGGVIFEFAGLLRGALLNEIDPARWAALQAEALQGALLAIEAKQAG